MKTHETRQDPGALVGFVDDLNGAIRDNPVAAGLVGMGVLWMLFGSSRLATLGRTLPGAMGTAARAVGETAGAAGSLVEDAVSDTASQVSEAARQIGDAVSSRVDDAGAALRDAANSSVAAVRRNAGSAANALSRQAKEGTGSSGDLGRQIGNSLQQNLTATLERQPLLLGVIGIAIGAGIASAFPSTKIEQDVMGDAGAAVKDRIREVASEASDFASERADTILTEIRREATTRGLTPAAAMESLKGVGENVKKAAATSRDAVKERFS